MAANGVEMISEQELEGLGLEAMEAGIEAEVEAEAETETAAESSPEAITEAALEGLEEGEMETETEAARKGRVPGFAKQLLKVLHRYVRVVVNRVLRVPALRNKLRAACQAGPAALTRFLAPLVLRALPIQFRFIVRFFLPRLIKAAFKQICKQAGGTKTKVELEAMELEF